MALLGRDIQRGPARIRGAHNTAVMLGVLLLALVGDMLAPAAALAQTPTLEYAVKANYLYKLGPFVGWPAHAFTSPSAPFTVCVLGRDPFGAALDQAVQGQSVAGRPVAVRRLQSVSRSSACHVLYIGRATEQPITEILQLLDGSPILTVTDERQGGRGGLVHFVVRDGRVRFGADASRARGSGLTLSSKLLGLAVPVGQPGGR